MLISLINRGPKSVQGKLGNEGISVLNGEVPPEFGISGGVAINYMGSPRCRYVSYMNMHGIGKADTTLSYTKVRAALTCKGVLTTLV